MSQGVLNKSDVFWSVGESEWSEFQRVLITPEIDLNES